MRRVAVEDIEDGLILSWARMSRIHLRMKELNDGMSLRYASSDLVGKLSRTKTKIMFHKLGLRGGIGVRSIFVDGWCGSVHILLSSEEIWKQNEQRY
jgi:hypothetical protein